MKALLFSDLHGSYRALSAIHDYCRNEKIPVIIFAGDAVNMGEPVSFIEELIWVINDLSLKFLWIPGNNDFGRAYHKLNARYKSLEGRITEYSGLKYTGVGGSPASWSGQYQGEQSVDKTAIAGTIFVSHVPPPGALHFAKIDRAITNDQDANSKQIPNSKFQIQNDLESEIKNLTLPKRLALADAPLVHICGHIHHTWGVGYLGTTKVIKLAGAYLGYYAIMDLNNLHVKFERFWK